MKKFLLLILLATLSFSAFSNSEINIDQKSKSLIAPEGTNYQWYHNGLVYMGGNEQSLEARQSGDYSVTYTTEEGEEKTISIKVAVTSQGIRKIHIIGDSTVMTYSSGNYPQMGWGQVLQLFFDQAQVEVVNHAIGGRSSRSFHEEGRWTPVRDGLNQGDYVFIQFGHNDRDWTKEERYTDTAQFKDYLRIYVNETRAQNATPVLISPMVMNAWTGSTMRNVFTEGSNDYRGAMLEVAEELDAYFVDLNMLSHSYFKDLGPEFCAKYFFLGLEPGEYPNYPDGKSDGTHFQEMGALLMAKLITNELTVLPEDTSITVLTNALRPTYQVDVAMTPSNAGPITLSEDYPEGAHVTIKTKADYGFTYKRLEDVINQTFTTDSRISFTVEPKEYSYKAVFDDCMGAEGGDHIIDNCNTCIPKSEACSNAIQSELACYYTGTFQTDITDGIETEYLLFEAGTPDTVHYKVLAPGDGEYKLGIKYSQGAENQSVDIYVNSHKQVSDLILPAAGNSWKIAAFNATLIDRNNFVSFVFPELEAPLKIDLIATYETGVKTGTVCKPVELVNITLESQLPDTKVNCYPNPFASAINLTGGSVSYQIYDLSGSLMEKGYCDVDCQIGQSLKSGTYILRTLTGKSQQSSLIIKE